MGQARNRTKITQALQRDHIGSDSSRNTIVQCAILFCRRVTTPRRSSTVIITLLNTFEISIVGFPLLLVPDTTAMAINTPYKIPALSHRLNAAR